MEMHFDDLMSQFFAVGSIRFVPPLPVISHHLNAQNLQKYQKCASLPKTQLHAYGTSNLVFLRKPHDFPIIAKYAQMPTYPNPKCTQK